MRKLSLYWFVITVLLLIWVGAASASAPEYRASAAQAAPARATLAEATVHVVQPGETLASIARRYGVGVWEIARHNGIANPDRIFVGQALRIPGPPAPPPTPVPPLLPCPCEEIVILSPTRGVTITSPVTVSGVASSPFEQTVVVVVLDGSGAQIGLEPGIIVGEMGERGPFTVTVPFSMPVNSQFGRIQVFTESPKDGAMEHLSSVTVKLQGLDLDASLTGLEQAMADKDTEALRALMAPQFWFALYGSPWADLPSAQAVALLWNDYTARKDPRLDFSVDAARMLNGRVTFPEAVRHIVFSTGWGPTGEDHAFLFFGVVNDRARWVGLLYIPRGQMDD